MTEATVPVFLSTAFSGPAWDRARGQLSQSRSGDASLDEVREELVLRDLFARYTYILDQGDVDALMTYFTDDCILKNPRGTCRGTAEIRANYEKLLRPTDRRLHWWSNVMTRVSDDLRHGWVTSYFYSLHQPVDEPFRTAAGLVADEWVKLDDAWRICDRAITVDIDSAINSA
jgi:hypothetical protein